MGKRSNFERIDKDFYATIDKRAVDTLLPFLLEIDGDLLLQEGHSRFLSYACAKGWLSLDECKKINKRNIPNGVVGS